MAILGIDIGGSGVKGAPVDIASGSLLAPRFRLATPQARTPAEIAGAVADVVRHFEWDGMIGCTLPMVVKGGVARSCANMHESWVGHDVRALFREATGCRVEVVNDADAAGVAEMRFGVAKGLPGVVVMLTFGTGIGSGLFVDGVLVPNTEFGHIEVGGKDAELRASAEVRNAKKLSWEQWAERVDRYLAALEACLWPDWIILGGGVSNKAEKWVPLLHTRAQIAVAALRNDAGIVGAAIVAGERFDYSNSSAAARSATRSTS